METIISALIAGGLALIGVIITNVTSNSKIEMNIAKAQAVTDTKLDLLTNEVQKHNNFAERIPVLENNVKQLQDDIKELKSR